MKNLKLLFVTIMSALCLSACGNSPDDNKIVVAASTVPHAEILNNIKEDVKAEGYELVVKEVTDYVTPNLMLDSGDVDANYFQHEPYLVDFNTNNKTDLVSAFKVHFEPMGIYSLRVTNFAWSTYPAGSSKIVIPNDTSNKERAMKLLNDNLKEFLSNYEIIEAEAQSIPALLNESNVMYTCINGNYALSAGITDKCIVTEPVDGETAQRNANLIAVKRENINKPFVEILRKHLLSEKTKSFIASKYGASVKAIF